MALALVVPVLIAAVVGGRIAGAIAAIAAALCFDFFFTLPYLSLRIAGSNDLTSFFVLLVVALIAAEVGIRARRGSRAAGKRVPISIGSCRVIELAAAAPTSKTSFRRHTPSSSACSGCSIASSKPARRTAAPPPRHPRRDRRRAARRDPHRFPASARWRRDRRRRTRHRVRPARDRSRRSRCARRSRSGLSRSRSPTNSASRSRPTRSAERLDPTRAVTLPIRGRTMWVCREAWSAGSLSCPRCSGAPFSSRR